MCAVKRLRKICSHLFRGNLAGLGRALAERVPVWLFRHNRAYFLEFQSERLSGDVQECPLLPDGYTFREVQLNDLSSCAALGVVSLDECRRRIMAGDHCYAVFCDGQVVNVSWTHYGRCYIRGVGLLIMASDSDCYLYGVFTDPNHRGKGLYAATMQVLRHCGSRNTQLVMEGSSVPLKTLDRLGYRVTRRVRHLTLCGLKMTMVDDIEANTRSHEVHLKSPVGVFRI